MIHTVKCFGVVSKAKVDVFLELSYFFSDPIDVGNLISDFSAFSKTSLNIWKLTVHVLLKTGLENFEHYSARVWDDRNCAALWAFFGIAFPWDWNENCLFPVLWPLLIYLSEKKCLALSWKRELEVDIFFFSLGKILWTVKMPMASELKSEIARRIGLASSSFSSFNTMQCADCLLISLDQYVVTLWGLPS